jgi:hypothetical protein
MKRPRPHQPIDTQHAPDSAPTRKSQLDPAATIRRFFDRINTDIAQAIALLAAGFSNTKKRRDFRLDERESESSSGRSWSPFLSPR